MNNLIQNAEQALSYMVAGRATVTLVSKKSGKRFTYRIRQPEAGSDRRFVSLLNGPDNTSDYMYMGMLVTSESGLWRIRSTQASRVPESAPSYRAVAWALRRLSTGEMPEELEVWHHGRCGRCGRTLTVPESISSGLGPVCAGRM